MWKVINEGYFTHEDNKPVIRPIKVDIINMYKNEVMIVIGF